MAGSVDALVRCLWRRFTVRDAARRRVVRMIGLRHVVAMAGPIASRRRSPAVITASKDAVREYVQSGQDGDQVFHGGLEWLRFHAHDCEFSAQRPQKSRSIASRPPVLYRR